MLSKKDTVLSLARKLSLGFVLVLSAAHAFAQNQKIEVAQSVPVETELAASGIEFTQKVWLEMIRSAKTTLNLEEFYIANEKGEALEPVLNELKKAAARGVEVRILLDTKFLKNYPEPAGTLGKIPHLQVRQLDLDPGVQHSKFIVADGQTSFVGSANLDWLALSHIHEVGLKIIDTAVASQLNAVFNKDWAEGQDLGANPDDSDNRRPRTGVAPSNSHTSLRVRPGENESIEVWASPSSMNPSGVAASLKGLQGMLASAEATIDIQVYQYTTKAKGSEKWTQLDSMIRQAAERGVKVRLLVDRVALKTGSTDLKALANQANIEVKTVTIPRWSGGDIPYSRLIHSKYMVVDQKVSWVGTENWSKDYFTQSRNVGVKVISTEVASQLKQIFEKVWSSPYAKAL